MLPRMCNAHTLRRVNLSIGTSQLSRAWHVTGQYNFHLSTIRKSLWRSWHLLVGKWHCCRLELWPIINRLPNVRCACGKKYSRENCCPCYAICLLSTLTFFWREYRKKIELKKKKLNGERLLTNAEIIKTFRRMFFGGCFLRDAYAR